jgi:molybdopterin converting factor small subunit
MQIKLKYFGQIAEIMNSQESIIKLNKKESSLFSIKHKLISEQPELKDINFKLALNSSIVNEDIMLNNNDEISFFPPFAGG